MEKLGINQLQFDNDTQKVRRLLRRRKEEEMMKLTNLKWTKSPK